MICEQVLNTQSLTTPLEASEAPDAAGRGRSRGFEIADVVYRPGAAFAWHDHERASLFVVLRGGVREQWGGVESECGAGTVGFLPAAGRHRSRFATQPVHTLSVMLDPAWLDTLGLDRAGGAKPGSACNEFVRAAALRLHAAARWDDPARRLACEEILAELLEWSGAMATPRVIRRAEAQSRMRATAETLRESRGMELSLGQLAAMSGRHAGHLCREFRAAFGVSLSQFHMLARVEQASFLLRATAGTLASVALESGFYDQAQFTRAFGRVMGCTPGEYREGFARG